jgi:hypothetical protein
LQSAGRTEEARDAYMQALAQAGSNQEGLNFSVLQQKLQSLTPVAARDLEDSVSVQLDMSEQAPAITDPVETLEQ